MVEHRQIAREAEGPKLEVIESYARYLYEGELERTQRMKAISATYLAVITTTFTAAVAVARALEIAPDTAGLETAPFAAAALFLIVAFICVVLSMRVERYERLSDPPSFVVYAEMVALDQVRRDIIANYAVATARNFEINEGRAQWLSRALLTYFLCLFMLFLWGGFLAWAR